MNSFLGFGRTRHFFVVLYDFRAIIFKKVFFLQRSTQLTQRSTQLSQQNTCFPPRIMSCHSRESIVPRLCDNRLTNVTHSTHSCDTIDSHLCDDLKVKDFYLFRQDIFWCLRQRQNYRFSTPNQPLFRLNQPLFRLSQPLFRPELAFYSATRRGTRTLQPAASTLIAPTMSGRDCGS